MTNWFLKAKHWQLFLLTFGLPSIFHLLLLRAIVHSASEGSEPVGMSGFMLIYFGILALLIYIMYGWLWSVAVGLQHMLPENVYMKIKKFRRFYNVPVITAVLSIVFGGALLNMMFTGSSPDLQIVFGNLSMVLIPLFLFSVFCIGYVIYFAVKTFKTVELQREVLFSDFAVEFLMFLIFPIGVWIIQPKINKLAM